MPSENVIRMTDDPPTPPAGAGAPNEGGGGVQDLLAHLVRLASMEAKAARPAANPAPRRRQPKASNPGAISRLLENFALIYGTQTVWDDETRRIVPVNALRLAMTSDAVKAWLGSPERRMVKPEELQFEPGRELAAPAINLFDGFEMQPAKGDCGPIIELLQYLCSESADTPEKCAQVCAWVLRWMALPLQRPGAKMRSALVFHGPQGAGKNLLFEIVAAIYGKYAMVVGQDQLEDKFNDWASMKLFLIGDEVVARAELYHHKNKLKSFITGETIQINAKMMPLRTEANHCNVVFLSNEQQPLALEPGDRRYLVVYTPPRDERGLYQRVAECLAHGGREAFYDFLLSVPLDGFDEFQIPPMTRAKEDLIELGLRPQERFIREWVAGYLPLPLRVCSTEQLYRAFQRWAQATGERFPPAQVVFSKGVEKAARGKLRCHSVKLDQGQNGKQVIRVWIPGDVGPPDGQTMGEWAKESCVAFESDMARFGRHFAGSKGEDGDT
jgi:putative DNA primase/helicase